MGCQIYIAGEKFKLTLNHCSPRQVGALLQFLGQSVQPSDETGRALTTTVEYSPCPDEPPVKSSSQPVTLSGTLGNALFHSRVRTHLQRLLILGNYLHLYERRKTFTAKQVRAHLVAAGVRCPRNLSAVLLQGVARGYLGTHGCKRWQRHRYHLTEQGLRFVERITNAEASNLSKDGAPTQRF